MTNKYFTGCSTLEDLKKLYHELAKKYHSDNGGNDEIMKEINAEYDAAHKILKNIHRKADGTTWTAEPGSKAENHENPEDFRQMVKDLLDELLKHDLTVEFIGCFVWVYGDTKPVKDALKKWGFKWHSKKLSWYLAPENYHRRGRNEYSFTEIRSMYGSKAYRGHERNDESTEARSLFQVNEYQPAPVL